jgi:hypothetical protein
MVIFECPICARRVTVEQREDAPHRPFCSERCKLIDLGRWLDGSYRIADPEPTPPSTGEPRAKTDDGA